MTQFPNTASLTKAELETGTTFAPKFDANGLVTAVTLDAASGEVLMVAHMNTEAIAETLRSGYATYWSRSRQALWKKGETSGELQELVEMRTDCDQDAIVMTVKQLGHGAACHTGKKSCFYRKVVLENGAPALADAGVPTLFDPEKIYR